jgi:hypothetical protein
LEEDVVVKFLLQMSNLGQLKRIEFGPSMAFSFTRQRPKADRPLKPPGKNWAKALEKRHPIEKSQAVELGPSREKCPWEGYTLV